MSIRVEISRAALLPPDLQAEINDTSQRLNVYSLTGVVRAEAEWRLLIWEDDQWVTRLDIFPRMVTVGAEPVFVGGVGGLMTRPAWRRRGFGMMALEQATAYIRDTLKADFGLLLCAPGDVNFYIRSKWQVVNVPTHYIQPNGRHMLPFNQVVTMVYVCRDELWHTGPINLCGLPW